MPSIKPPDAGDTVGDGTHRQESASLYPLSFKHRLLRDQVALPNLVGAIAIARAIRGTHELDARIKAPNDVRIGKKKVAGVLTELAYDDQRQPFFRHGLRRERQQCFSGFSIRIA